MLPPAGVVRQPLAYLPSSAAVGTFIESQHMVAPAIHIGNSYDVTHLSGKVLHCMLITRRNANNIVSAITHYSSQIERCISGRQLNIGRLLHSHLIKTSIIPNTFISNRIIEMYAKCGYIRDAQLAFEEIPVKNTHSWNILLSSHCRAGQFGNACALLDKIPNPNLVSYNSLISGLTCYGHHREALEVLQKMQRKCGPSIIIDKFTVVGVVGACGGASDLRSLRQLHGVVVSIGLEFNQIIYNTMIDAYGKCGDADSSRCLFDEMESKDVVSWTSLVGAYASTSRLEEAHRVFDLMPSRNAISWTALITGYAQHGQGDAALKLFKEMIEEGFYPSPFTLVSALSACTGVALIGRGKQLHGYVVRRAFESDYYDNVFIQNALLDMYAKCGDMYSGVALFERMHDRDTISWNSLVTGFAQNGCGGQALAYFQEMISSEVKPNHITFLSVLSACNHAGLVSEGRHLLETMEKYGVRARPEHHAVIVDLLGRSCRLEEAKEVLETMPYNAKLGGVGTWGALLGACRVHGDVDLAKEAADSLIDLEPMNGGRYVMLSNIYAAAGRWEDARRTRKLMKEKGLRKEPACSWIEVRDVKHTFLAEDKSHCRTEEIYKVLTVIAGHIKDLASCILYEQSLFNEESTYS
ncbi:hypothetical protein Taro_010750 [Colocasia esculenta]|uniref:Pentatricopeptide repeat-containing protein n=1 Tax=Colocasia esculenta TaxID=4460 RepID=A0A843UAK4_COLES|nr:hypothetical protein [Colocasia esculenta]